MRRGQILLLMLVALVLLSGCTQREPTGVAYWFCIISFAVAVICGFIAVAIRNDSTRVASGIICVIFLVVSLGILA
jgi:hypothetical protein